jgi:hypothetical protein
MKLVDLLFHLLTNAQKLSGVLSKIGKDSLV